MLPSSLLAKHFDAYPLAIKEFTVAHLPLLRRIPLSLLPALLTRLISYEQCFPTERSEIREQITYLNNLDIDSFRALMEPFAQIDLPANLVVFDWVNYPVRFEAMLSSTLWSLNKRDLYRQGATTLQEHFESAMHEPELPIPRLTMVLLGHDVAGKREELFRMLRPHGTLFTQVNPELGSKSMFDLLNARTRAYPEPYTHWYVEGGQLSPVWKPSEGVSVVSFQEAMPAARKMLLLANRESSQENLPGMTAPEAMEATISSMSDVELGLDALGKDIPLREFQRRVLAEGAGAQIFSTTFVQWSAREALRRAKPLTLLARFGSRQQFAPMNELLARDPLDQMTDPEGSLIDADMAAYYTWINQSRLTGSSRGAFLAWHEGQSTAIAISPVLPQGVVSNKPAWIEKILSWMI